MLTDLLVPFIVLLVIGWVSYRYLPMPIGLVIAVVCGLIFLVNYLLPLL